MSQVVGDADFAPPVEDRWFEDYAPGADYEFGHVEVTEDEIVAFARVLVVRRLDHPERVLHGQCTDLAAALTYYVVLALFPAIIAMLSLVGLVGKGPRPSRP